MRSFYSQWRRTLTKKPRGKGGDAGRARVLESPNTLPPMHVVWFAEIKWDYLRTRKQQLVRRRPSGTDVLFLEPWTRGRDNPPGLRSRDGISVGTVPFLKAIPSGPLRGLLATPPARRAVDALALRRVRQHLTRAGVDPARATFVVSNVFAIDVALALKPARLVYDMNDAHADFPGMPYWTHDYQERTLRRADAVTASGAVLADEAARVRGSDAGVHRIGNGVDVALFAGVHGTAAPDTGVRIGYLGAVGPWFDFQLVCDAARRKPEWRFDVIGPVLAGTADGVAALSALPNVSLRPAVAHEDVPRVMASFTVGLIPFLSTPLTAGVNPNKLYEYLAAGVPVVSTPFSRDVLENAGLVERVSDPAQLVAACERLAAARQDAAQRAGLAARAADLAARFDWDRLAAAFWQVVLTPR